MSNMNTRKILELLGTTSDKKLQTLEREEYFPVTGESSANEMLNADLYGRPAGKRSAIEAAKTSTKVSSRGRKSSTEASGKVIASVPLPTDAKKKLMASKKKGQLSEVKEEIDDGIASEPAEEEEIPTEATGDITCMNIVNEDGISVAYLDYDSSELPQEVVDSISTAISDAGYTLAPSEDEEPEGETADEAAAAEDVDDDDDWLSDIPSVGDANDVTRGKSKKSVNDRKKPIERILVSHIGELSKLPEWKDVRARAIELVNEAEIVSDKDKQRFEYIMTHNSERTQQKSMVPFLGGEKLDYWKFQNYRDTGSKPKNAGEMVVETGEGKFPEEFDFDEEAFGEEYGIDPKEISCIYVEENTEAKIPEHIEVSFTYEESNVVLNIYADSTVEETVDAQEVDPQFSVLFDKEEDKDGNERDVMKLDLVGGEGEDDGVVKSEGDDLTKSEGDEDHTDEEGKGPTDEFYAERGDGIDKFHMDRMNGRYANTSVHSEDPEDSSTNLMAGGVARGRNSTYPSRESVSKKVSSKKAPARLRACAAHEGIGRASLKKTSIKEQRSSNESLAARVIRNRK